MSINNKNFSNKYDHSEPMAEEADTIKCLTTKVTLLKLCLRIFCRKSKTWLNQSSRKTLKSSTQLMSSQIWVIRAISVNAEIFIGDIPKKGRHAVTPSKFPLSLSI
jgi:hypothetical protein